jgi:hypothetical protein
MLQILILVCATGLSPSDCSTENALDVYHAPIEASDLMCGIYGQAFLAQTSLASRSPGEYLKIKCARSSFDENRLRSAFPAQRVKNRRLHRYQGE